MKFRNYCIVVMGNLEGIKDDIIKVAETKPRYIDAKGIFIATFASVAEPAELEDFFRNPSRSFMVFDTDKKSSGYHFDNEQMHHHLFGYLIDSENKLREMSNNLMDNISATTRDNITRPTHQPKPILTKKVLRPSIDYSRLTKKEREVILNGILDKGPDKLTDSDKETIKKIAELG
jgi:hypothetical protein